MTNAECIRQMSDEQLYEFLSEWECGDIDYSVTFCDLCNEATKRGEIGNALNLDCDGCRKHWLQRDAVDYGGLMYWKKNTTFDTTADRKTEPTISKMEQVDKDINVRSKDEPQTDEHCETCRHKDECEGATYEYKNTEWWCLGYAPIDEPQTVLEAVLDRQTDEDRRKMAEPVRKAIKDEPQTFEQAKAETVAMLLRDHNYTSAADPGEFGKKERNE